MRSRMGFILGFSLPCIVAVIIFSVGFRIGRGKKVVKVQEPAPITQVSVPEEPEYWMCSINGERHIVTVSSCNKEGSINLSKDVITGEELLIISNDTTNWQKVPKEIADKAKTVRWIQ